jgi:hypothetical protein
MAFQACSAPVNLTSHRLKTKLEHEILLRAVLWLSTILNN